MKKVLGLLLVLVLGFVSSTNYYVSNSGNDSWDGKSDATAWKTIEKVNSFNFSVGDDVYFKCGSKWARKQLIVDWGGNVNNPVVIGAYYGNGSKGILGNKPIFQGALHTVENGEITTPGYPSSVWGSLLLIRKEYVTIANISFENSGGYFLEAEGNKYNTSHLKLINLDGNLSTTAGFVFMNVNDVEVMGCDVTGNGYGKVVQGLDIAWGAAIALVNTNNTYIHHNNVHENWGECINHNSGSRNGIVEYNTVYDCRSVGIYLDGASYMTARYNLVYGTTNDVYYRIYKNGIRGNGHGIYIEDEDNGTRDSSHINIYNNFVAHCRTCFFSGRDNDFDYIDVVNNTFIGCHTGVRLMYNIYSNSKIMNNIISLEGGNALYDGPAKTPGLLWDYNHWSNSVGEDPNGTHDKIGPTYWDNKENWENLNAGGLKLENFVLMNGSISENCNNSIDDDSDGLIDCLDSNCPACVPPIDVVDVSDIFEKISEWKAGQISLDDVFVVIRAWGEGGWL